MNAGPAIGEAAPRFDTIEDMNNHPVTLGVERAKRTLLLFITTGCANCASLIPRLKRLAYDERSYLEVVLVAFGSNLETCKDYAEQYKLNSTVPLIASNSLALRYQVTIAPYGIMIDRNGIVRAKGIVNNFSHVESLLNAEEEGVRSIEEYLIRGKGLPAG